MRAFYGEVTLSSRKTNIYNLLGVRVDPASFFYIHMGVNHVGFPRPTQSLCVVQIEHMYCNGPYMTFSYT